jgi:outer membrane murein-binding lipoprotein Lpp
MSGTLPLIAEMRKQLVLIGASEMDSVSRNETLQSMWSRLQELREEMNEAKMAAAQEAARPYLELMTKIERDYVMIVKLSSAGN